MCSLCPLSYVHARVRVHVLVSSGSSRSSGSRLEMVCRVADTRRDTATSCRDPASTRSSTEAGAEELRKAVTD